MSNSVCETLCPGELHSMNLMMGDYLAPYGGARSIKGRNLSPKYECTMPIPGLLGFNYDRFGNMQQFGYSTEILMLIRNGSPAQQLAYNYGVVKPAPVYLIRPRAGIMKIIVRLKGRVLRAFVGDLLFQGAVIPWSLANAPSIDGVWTPAATWAVVEPPAMPYTTGYQGHTSLIPAAQLAVGTDLDVWFTADIAPDIMTAAGYSTMTDLTKLKSMSGFAMTDTGNPNHVIDYYVNGTLSVLAVGFMQP